MWNLKILADFEVPILFQKLTRKSDSEKHFRVFAPQKLEVQQCVQGGTLLNRTSLYAGQLEFVL